MAGQNELTYLIKYANDEASYNARLKDIDKLEKQRADKGRPKASKGTKERLDEIKKEESALKELRKTLRQYREDLATVQQTVRQTGQATEGNIAVQKSLGEAIGETRKQIEQATRGSLDYDTILQQQPTTYNELVQQNRALSLAMRDIPLEDTSGRLQELQVRYKENNDALKAFDAELGNHQRNVGNYQGSLEGVITSLRGGANAIAIFQGPLGPLAGRINSLATTLSRLSQTQTANSAGAATFGRILSGNIPLITTTAGAMTAKGRAAGVANTAIRALNVSLRATRVAFIALGIPALLVALGALTSFFTRTEEGQQRLRVITAGLSAAFSVFTDRASALGKVISDAFQDPQKAVKQLWEVIKQNIINRFTAIPKIFQSGFEVLSKGAQAAAAAVRGIWSKSAREEAKQLFAEAKSAYKDYANGVIQLTTGIEDGIDKLRDGVGGIVEEANERRQEGMRLQEEMNDVLVRERDLMVERAEMERDMARAREKARDMDLSAEERLRNLQKVREAEVELMEEEMQLELDRLRIMEEQAGMSDNREQDEQKLAEQRAAIFKLEEEHAKRMMTFNRDELATQRQMREEDVRMTRFAFEQRERQRALDLDREVEALELRGRTIEAETIRINRMLKDETRRREQRQEQLEAEFRNQRFSEKEAADMAYEQARIESEQRIFDAEKRLSELSEEERQQQLELRKFESEQLERQRALDLDRELKALELRGRATEAETIRLNRLIEDEERRSLERRAELEEEFRQRGIEDSKAAEMAEEQSRVESEQRIFDARKRLAEMEIEMRAKNLKMISDLIGATNEAVFGDSKALAIAQSLINTYQAVTANLAQGGTRGFIMAATAFAQGVANVRRIMSTNLGDTSTPSGTSSSVARPSFGLVDTGTNQEALASGMASMFGGGQPTIEPTIVLEGEFDPEVLSIKVRTGNDAISGRTVGAGL